MIDVPSSRWRLFLITLSQEKIKLSLLLSSEWESSLHKEAGFNPTLRLFWDDTGKGFVLKAKGVKLPKASLSLYMMIIGQGKKGNSLVGAGHEYSLACFVVAARGPSVTQAWSPASSRWLLGNVPSKEGRMLGNMAADDREGVTDPRGQATCPGRTPPWEDVSGYRV